MSTSFTSFPMMRFAVLALCVALCLSSPYVQQTLTVIYQSGATTTTTTTSTLIDEQRYSRQLFVYGRRAQQRLQEGHVIVVCGEEGPGGASLAAETIKNLALAGIGRISVYQPEGGRRSRLQGSASSLAAYAHELNPLVVAQDVPSLAALGDLIAAVGRGDDGADDGGAVVLAADTSLAAMSALSNQCRLEGRGRVLFTGCRVESVCGLVINDFGPRFEVTDVDGDGDSGKDIPIRAAVAGGSGGSGGILHATCIDEEAFTGLGIGDCAELAVELESGSGGGAGAGMGGLGSLWGGGGGGTRISKVFTVSAVGSTRALTLQCPLEDGALVCGALKAGLLVTLRKTKRAVVVSHLPVEQQLIRPAFTPGNACLPDKRDRAMSLALLAALKAVDSGRGFSGEPQFTACLLARLISMGVADPLLPLKRGGAVGVDAVAFVAPRFFRSLPHLRSAAGGAGEGGRAAAGPKCPATVSVVGALASQEVIKAVTHIYQPASMLLFESLDSLPDEDEAAAEAAAAATAGVGAGASREGAGLRSLYGAAVSAELAALKVFVVGAGAIGCELIKTFALMGVGAREPRRAANSSSSSSSGGGGKGRGSANASRRAPRAANGTRLFPPRGGLVVTDMDHIERSNLNRQLLFREKHVGQPKSLVAAEAARALNPQLHIRAVTSKVGAGAAAGGLDEAFWRDCHAVVTALDNVDARRFVDAQCVRHRLALLDSGTLGTRGNTQCVLPFVTESYASSSDPPEEAIPLCTLKSFPYLPEHAVSWARSAFDLLFGADVRALKTFATEVLAQRAAGGPTASLEHVLSALRELPAEDLARLSAALRHLPSLGDSFESLAARSLRWALLQFRSIFQEDVAALIAKHPQNSTDDEGQPFWGVGRRFPRELTAGFDAVDPLHCDFARWGAWLFAKSFGHHQTTEAKVLAFSSDDLLRRALDSINITSSSSSSSSSSAAPTAESVLAQLRALALPPELWRPEEFEKDDASLGHVAFVTAAANLRCALYGLPGVDQLQVQRVAGKIVPALATSTALVAGLVSLELLKLAAERVRSRRAGGQGAEVDADRLLARHRNSFVNVARPMLAFAQPVPAAVFGAGAAGGGTGKGFTLWDRLEMPAGRGADLVTVSAVASWLRGRLGLSLQSLSCRDLLLFADFLPDSSSRLSSKLAELLRAAREEAEVGGRDDRAGEEAGPEAQGPQGGQADAGDGWLELEVGAVDDEGEDVRLPPLRLRLASSADAAADAAAEEGDKGPAEGGEGGKEGKGDAGGEGAGEGGAEGGEGKGEPSAAPAPSLFERVSERARAAAGRVRGLVLERMRALGQEEAEEEAEEAAEAGEGDEGAE